MAATPYVLQLVEQAKTLRDGADTYVVVANSTADAAAFVQNLSDCKAFTSSLAQTLAAAADMAEWRMRVAIYKHSDNSVLFDQTVTNADQVERVVLATGVLTSSLNYGTSDTVTIGTRTYSFVASPAVDGDVKIAGSEAASITNLVRAINNSGGTPGTDYVVTAADPSVTAVAAAHTCTVTALPSIIAATANAVATTVSMTTGNGAWGAVTLSGGVDSENKLSSLAELIIAALTASGYHPSLNNSTHVLTLTSIADNVGDAAVSVEVYPPTTETFSPVGSNNNKGIPVPGFVGAITTGVAASAITVALVADTYVVPNLIATGRMEG